MGQDNQLIVRRSADIKAPAANVWDVIVSPGQWKRWMLVEPELETGRQLQLGSRVLWKNEDGTTYLTGTVTVLEPDRRLVLELDDVSWDRRAEPGEVTYSLALSERGDSTHVQFTLGDLSIDPEGKQWYDAYAASRELEAIRELVENPSRSETSATGAKPA